MREFNFEKLEVYQEAVALSNKEYEITKSFPKTEMFGITSQLRRAAVSISSNIAEGSGRTSKEFAHFINIALGSTFECIPLLEIARQQDYLENTVHLEIKNELHKISAKLHALKIL